MPLNAGLLRHWVDIEEPVDVQDSDGAISRTWVLFRRVPASIEPLSAREFIAAQSVQSKVVARVVIRALNGINARMRIHYAGKLYNIEGVLADKDSGLDYMTLPVGQGVNDGR